MPEIDLLQEIGSEVIQTKYGITRVEGNGASVHFGDENPVELKQAINRSIRQVMAHYKPRNEKYLVGNYLSEVQLLTMSRNIVLHILYMYSNWRRTNKNCENIELELGPTDFDNVTTNRVCYSFCKSTLGSNFRNAASALMGMSIDELRKFEVAEDKYANR